MAFNGSGVFNRIHNWVTDKGNSVPITASRFDTELDGMATGLSTCITKDGQTTTTAIIPFALGIAPATSDGAALGSITKQWSDAFLATGGVINWNNGDVTITHSANALAFAGATGGYSFDDDLLLPSAGVLNFNGGDVTITHSANALAFAGGTSYTYDAAVTVSNAQNGAATISAFVIDRNSASPDVSDFLGRVVFQGRTSTAATASYAEIDSQITDPTNGSEDGRVIVRTKVAGSMVDSLIATGNVSIKGTATNDNAAAGYVGEYVSSGILVASGVALTTATPANVTNISLPAGDWDVVAQAGFNTVAASDFTALTACTSRTSGAITVAGDPTEGRTTYAKAAGAMGIGNDNVVAVAPVRMSLAATTTVYLVVQADFTAGTCAGYGYISARRVR